MSGYPSDWDTRRKNVYKRDNYQCQHCGARGGPYGNTELHAHHVVPKSQGGSHALSNLTTLCDQCHQAAHGNGMAGRGAAAAGGLGLGALAGSLLSGNRSGNLGAAMWIIAAAAIVVYLVVEFYKEYVNYVMPDSDRNPFEAVPDGMQLRVWFVSVLVGFGGMVGLPVMLYYPDNGLLIAILTSSFYLPITGPMAYRVYIETADFYAGRIDAPTTDADTETATAAD